jgi:hypothetical protein
MVATDKIWRIVCARRQIARDLEASSVGGWQAPDSRWGRPYPSPLELLEIVRRLKESSN